MGARVALADGSLLGVHRVALVEEGEGRGDQHTAADGEPARGGLIACDGRLLLRCSPGLLELLDVQPAGGREMDAASFLRGRQRPQGRL